MDVFLDVLYQYNLLPSFYVNMRRTGFIALFLQWNSTIKNQCIASLTASCAQIGTVRSHSLYIQYLTQP
jgi:hypothetical protein